MNYLLYIEHAAENLQFFLWYRDYSKRFNEAKTSDIGLAPEWTQAMHDAAIQAAQVQATAQKKTIQANTAAEIFKGTDFEKGTKVHVTETSDPFTTPPRTPTHVSSTGPWDSQTVLSHPSSVYTSTKSTSESYQQQAGEAFNAAGLKQPFTIQPFREEMNRVIATYIKQYAPRELNLSDRERTAVLKALEYTTHPSAFRAIHQTVENSLRRQAHPNFIRWTICNGNRPRVLFARGLGIALIIVGIVAAIIITLSHAGRGWRALAIIGWAMGVATLMAGYKGMCVVLHGMHHRHLRPWELFEDPESELEMKKRSFESLDSDNSYEDAPWVVKYEKRNIIRKIFDREVWVEEPALRQIQDTIFIQSVLTGLFVAAVLCGIFVAVPAGNFF